MIKNHIFIVLSIIIVTVAIAFFISLLGIDEILINSTVNRPYYSCVVDSDCAVKQVSNDLCGRSECVNKNWNYYNSIIRGGFALSCFRPIIICSCIENVCDSTKLPLLNNKTLAEILDPNNTRK